ncbi:aryl-alcohol dehydrogenase-like predicted oxidoreductase [Pseudonocardia sediminis]|uniref:Aryl-alcohol dehydrogenase-like predicted oxidoreductase n=1 Tax=Pseudonocardia sediminis TaxID=1397368 RepID=A0A4Q7V3S2_PSEST|nr:aldo/keto reductase [Pseudonocardia sediminis]RZT88134.1 aryl-alcohol dehydrogenase-like predicted oxidoreductase [Pseudonocardia sediminis]
MSTTLDTYRLLGRSGLRVSPLALGTATFGTEWGWGAEKEQARALFDTYVEHGGNFVDTASTYTDGSSERLLGEFIREHRERLVVATKYTTLRTAGDPNSGGPHRKSLFASVEASLRRLGTDVIDLLYLHVWDFTTPVEEILRGLDDLVRQGKVHYVAMSNVPAWEISRMQAIADLRGWTPLVALQPEYSLINRAAERDLIPMAREMGLGVTPFSPVGGGVLAGRYTRADLAGAAGTRPGESNRKTFNAGLGMVTERTLTIADVVGDIASETDRTPAQIALAWVLDNPGVTAPVIGARTAEQLLGNLGALDVDLTAEQLARLDSVSAIDLGYPHDLLAGDHARAVSAGDLTIERHRR